MVILSGKLKINIGILGFFGLVYTGGVMWEGQLFSGYHCQLYPNKHAVHPVYCVGVFLLCTADRAFRRSCQQDYVRQQGKDMVCTFCSNALCRCLRGIRRGRGVAPSHISHSFCGRYICGNEPASGCALRLLRQQPSGNRILDFRGKLGAPAGSGFFWARGRPSYPAMNLCCSLLCFSSLYLS